MTREFINCISFQNPESNIKSIIFPNLFIFLSPFFLHFFFSFFPFSRLILSFFLLSPQLSVTPHLTTSNFSLTRQGLPLSLDGVLTYRSCQLCLWSIAAASQPSCANHHPWPRFFVFFRLVFGHHTNMQGPSHLAFISGFRKTQWFQVEISSSKPPENFSCLHVHSVAFSQ